MKRIILAGFFLAAGAGPAAASYVPSATEGGSTDASGSQALSTTAANVWAANSSRLGWRLQNTDFITESGGTGYTAWCRWGTAGAAPASAHGVGSFMLAAGQDMSDSGVGVSRAALNCVAETGTPILYAEQR